MFYLVGIQSAAIMAHHIVIGPYQKTAGSAGWIVDRILRCWPHHIDYTFDQLSRVKYCPAPFGDSAHLSLRVLRI